jgi:hypothetical protein
MGLFDESDRLRGRKGRTETLPRLRLSSPSYARDTRSERPEAVLKVTSFARGARAKNVIEYITRAKKKDNLEFENEGGQVGRGREDIKKVYEDWRQDFERKKAGAKREPRHVTHIILSAKAPNDAETAYKVNNAARDFLAKEFGEQGYQYVFVTHRDRDNPHVHVVLKNYNRTLNNKLRLDKHDLLELRRAFAAELQKQGIEHVATRALDRPLQVKDMQARIERLKKRENLHQRQLRRAPGGADLLAERQKLARAVIYAKDAVKKATLPLTPARRSAMTELRALNERLTQVPIEQFKKEAAGTIEKLGRDVQGLKKTLTSWQELEKRAGEKKPPSHSQRLAQRRFVEKFATRYEKDLFQTAAVIRKAPLADIDRRAMLTALQQQQKLFQGLARGGLGRGGMER